MRKYMLGAALVIAVVLIASCTKKEIETTTTELTLEDVLASADVSQDIKIEIKMHVEQCGKDVVGKYDGKPTSKGCEYRISLSGFTLQSNTIRGGLLEDDAWPWHSGVKWQAASRKDREDVPVEWDFRELGRASEVKINRQVCGDCWSQASTKALELMIAAHDNKIEELSVQTQISRCSGHGSCGGGYMTAPDFLIKYGNPFETQDPYKGYNTSCKFSQAEMNAGFKYKIEDAPWVGNSMRYSRFFKPEAREGAKVENIKALMWKYKSPAVVTIAAIGSNGGIINSCSRINSGGNHMQDIIGWYPHDGYQVAMAWNSWGTNHGQNGVTHMKWECGDGNLNRGLGRYARVYKYASQCDEEPDAYTGPNKDFVKTTPDHGVMIGKDSGGKQTCTWMPNDGLTQISADGCRQFASPDVTTEYHLTAKNACGEQSAMVLIRPLKPNQEGYSSGEKETILTPHGLVEFNHL